MQSHPTTEESTLAQNHPTTEEPILAQNHPPEEPTLVQSHPTTEESTLAQNHPTTEEPTLAHEDSSVTQDQRFLPSSRYRRVSSVHNPQNAIYSIKSKNPDVSRIRSSFDQRKKRRVKLSTDTLSDEIMIMSIKHSHACNPILRASASALVNQMKE